MVWCSCKRRVKERVTGRVEGFVKLSKDSGDWLSGTVGSKYSSSGYTLAFSAALFSTKCLMWDIFNSLILLFAHLILTLVSEVSTIVAWPSHLGANFLFLPKKLCSENRTKSPTLKSWVGDFCQIAVYIPPPCLQYAVEQLIEFALKFEVFLLQKIPHSANVAHPEREKMAYEFSYQRVIQMA